MLPLLWPRIACRVSWATPAARNRRPTVCRRSCTCSVLKPSGGGSPNLPGFRRRSIPLVNLFVRAVTGARLTDATCGFRALRLDLLRRADFDWHAPWLHTYGLEYYLYAKVLLDRRIRWTEIPVTMRYPAAGPYSKIRAESAVL